MIAWVKVDPDSRCILTFSEAEAKRLREEYELPAGAVRSWRSPNLGNHPREYAIDNLDLVLTAMYGGLPAAVTLS